MRFTVAIALLTVIALQVADGARRCMSGSGKNYREKLCGTGGDHNVDCHQFKCEGGRSPFVLRTCGDTTRTSTGCEAGIVTCNRAGGTGSCFTCSTDNCNGDPKEGTPTGGRGNNNGGHNHNNGGSGHGGGSNHNNGGNRHSGGGSNRNRGGANNNGGNSNGGSLASKLIDILIKGSGN